MTGPVPNGVDYVESGTGPPVLFVSGSFSTPRVWQPLQAELPQRYRMIATSLCGYGKTVDRRTPGDLSMTPQLDVVAEVADLIGAPVHLVGHSFGGTVALLAALSGRVAVRSVTTFEANPFVILSDGPHRAMVQKIRAMSDAFEAAHRRGEPDAAGRIIDYWGGAGSFDAMPGAVRDYCRATCKANVMDWTTAHRIRERPEDFAVLSRPVLLVRGGRANPVMRALTSILAKALPDVRTAVVKGAGHFPITTHPGDSAALLATFLQEVDEDPREVSAP